MRLRLFGSPAVEHDGGTSHALPFERRAQLIVLLALRRAWVPRADVAAMLWPEQETKLAFTNLRKTLFRLPSAPWGAGVESEGNALRVSDLDTDVAAFESALREQRGADALAAYRGEFLAGFDDGQNEAWTRWLHFERERLRTAWRGAALAWLADEQRDAAEAIALSARLLEADALDEAALREHMRWLARDGQAAAARAAYRTFAQRLSLDLGLEPGAALRALHESVSAPATIAAPTPADDGFVGRSIELQRIADLLVRAECRLLCLIGPGGVGKTRLAQRVVQTLAPSFTDGALFVPLEDVASADAFAARLARDLGAGRGVGRDALAPVIEALAGQQLLLVLDNFEQLAEHALLLDRLLQAAPRLKLLVTSRVRLAVPGEWSMPVEGLPYPEPEDEDRAEAFDAVRLFVRAAQRVEPGFAPAAEAASIVDICRQVEGLPLAIELAAAWVRVLSCDAIAAELRHGAELLRAQDSTHPARHASIEQVFEQSWQHLGAAERDALARLSVFRGGFTAAAARAVAGAPLPVIGALVDKSLLTKDGARMHLHPLVQQFAAERLGGSPAREATQAAHVDYFGRLLAGLDKAAEDGDRAALLAIDADFDNARCAFLVAATLGRHDALRASQPALLAYAEHRARFDEGLALLRSALESPSVRADTPLQVRLQAEAAWLEFRLVRYPEAQAQATRALDEARALGDEVAALVALRVLGACALNGGRSDEAHGFEQEALALARSLGDQRAVAKSLDNLALVEKRLGRYEASLQLAIQALAQHRRNGDGAAEALCLSNLGSMYLFLQDDAAAELHLREALGASEKQGLVSTRAYVLANLTELEMRRGDVDAARTHAERALDIAESAGLRALAGWLQVQLARFAVQRRELDAAAAWLARGAELALTLGAPYVKAAAMLGLAEWLEARGHPGAALRVLAFAVEQETLAAPDRDELRVEWARRAAGTPQSRPWPGLSLDELLHRVVIERDAQLAPLTAQLA